MANEKKASAVKKAPAVKKPVAGEGLGKQSQEAEKASFDEKANPTDVMQEADANRVRPEGNWIKATTEEIAKYEDQGILVGHDRKNGEVLLLEKE